MVGDVIAVCDAVVSLWNRFEVYGDNESAKKKLVRRLKDLQDLLSKIEQTIGQSSIINTQLKLVNDSLLRCKKFVEDPIVGQGFRQVMIEALRPARRWILAQKFQTFINTLIEDINASIGDLNVALTHQGIELAGQTNVMVANTQQDLTALLERCEQESQKLKKELTNNQQELIDFMQKRKTLTAEVFRDWAQEQVAVMKDEFLELLEQKDTDRTNTLRTLIQEELANHSSKANVWLFDMLQKIAELETLYEGFSTEFQALREDNKKIKEWFEDGLEATIDIGDFEGQLSKLLANTKGCFMRADAILTLCEEIDVSLKGLETSAESESGKIGLRTYVIRVRGIMKQLQGNSEIFESNRCLEEPLASLEGILLACNQFLKSDEAKELAKGPPEGLGTLTAKKFSAETFKTFIDDKKKLIQHALDKLEVYTKIQIHQKTNDIPMPNQGLEEQEMVSAFKDLSQELKELKAKHEQFCEWIQGRDIALRDDVKELFQIHAEDICLFLGARFQDVEQTLKQDIDKVLVCFEQMLIDKTTVEALKKVDKKMEKVSNDMEEKLSQLLTDNVAQQSSTFSLLQEIKESKTGKVQATISKAGPAEAAQDDGSGNYSAARAQEKEARGTHDNLSIGSVQQRGGEKIQASISLADSALAAQGGGKNFVSSDSAHAAPSDVPMSLISVSQYVSVDQRTQKGSLQLVMAAIDAHGVQDGGENISGMPQEMLHSFIQQRLDNNARDQELTNAKKKEKLLPK